MALIAPQTIPGSAATAITYSAANSGGDTVAYNKTKKQLLLVKTGSGARTVTITAVRTSVQTGRDVAALANIVDTIGAGAERAFPITPGYAGTDGLVAITYTSVANTEVALLEF